MFLLMLHISFDSYWKLNFVWIVKSLMYGTCRVDDDDDIDMDDGFMDLDLEDAMNQDSEELQVSLWERDVFVWGH